MLTNREQDINHALTNSVMKLIVTLFIVSFVASCALPSALREAPLKVQEDYLQEYLMRIRKALREYSGQRGHPPQTLDELVDADYLTHVPIDPFTDKADWVLVPYNCSASSNCKEGIKDVHSRSTTKSTKGTSYAEW